MALRKYETRACDRCGKEVELNGDAGSVDRLVGGAAVATDQQ